MVTVEFVGVFASGEVLRSYSNWAVGPVVAEFAKLGGWYDATARESTGLGNSGCGTCQCSACW
jgi:hypothetical protein